MNSKNGAIFLVFVAIFLISIFGSDPITSNNVRADEGSPKATPTPTPTCCEIAANAPDFNGASGGVVCCNGYSTVCVWETTSQQSPGSKEIETYCTERHEADHYTDTVPCTELPDGERPGWAPDKNPDQEECKAYTKNIECLRDNLPNCEVLAQPHQDKCWSDIEAEIEFCRQQWDVYCGAAPGPIPTPVPTHTPRPTATPGTPKQ